MSIFLFSGYCPLTIEKYKLVARGGKKKGLDRLILLVVIFGKTL
jgi:hypothetical protein